MSAFRILCIGSWTWTDQQTVAEALSEYLGAPKVVLVTGDCPRGSDSICEAFALSHGWQVWKRPLDWRLGDNANHIRNTEMVADGADVCLAFICGPSRDASSAVVLAKMAGLKTLIFEQRTEYWDLRYKQQN